jgi:CD109 antigen
MILPPSLVRGEILHLQVIVYNYFDRDLSNVKVKLLQTSDFKVSTDKKSAILDDMTSDMLQTIPFIEKQTAQSVEFLVSPTKIGQLPLTVKVVANGGLAGDGETKKLKVKPEGIEQVTNLAMLTQLNSNGKSKETKDFQIILPEDRVKNSEFCSIQVIGDFLGPALNNLNRLIQKPYGCGEQNMVTFTPNIFAIEYLQLSSRGSTQKVTNLDAMVRNAKSNIQHGYQNQLKYARDDGSFSAFGQSDKVGSTWLTSFVLKSFARARKYANIDENVINKAKEFLIKQQETNGAFLERGRLLNTNMQGL